MNTELHGDNFIQDCEVLWSYSDWSCTALQHFFTSLFTDLKFLIVNRI